MHRLITQPAQIPLDTDILNAERWALQGLGQLAGATHGFGVTAASGLVVTPGSSGLTVTVAPGAVLQTAATDPTAYGSLAADADLTVQQWLLDTATTVTVPATNTTYYVYVTQVTADDTPVVLPYYNASNPSQTYAGAGNGGATQPTRRAKTLTVSIATSVPSGSIQIGTVLVPSGNTTVAAANITGASGTQLPPFYPTIPQLVQGRLLNIQRFTASSSYTPTPGARLIKIRAIAGGGAGGGVYAPGSSAQATASGGASGSYAEAYYLISALTLPVAVTIGAAGTPASAAQGGPGGQTNFGSYISCPGGGGGPNAASATTANTVSQQAAPGAAPTLAGQLQGIIVISGQPGPCGFSFANFGVFSGQGAPSPMGSGGGNTNNGTGSNASGNGAGGGGSAAIAGGAAVGGGFGSAGLIVIEEYA